MNKWDKYYLGVCNTVSTNSECLSRKIGSIIVNDKSIVSTGYNGPPRGVSGCTERHMLGDTKLRDLLRQAKAIPELIDSEYLQYLSKCPRQLLGFESGEGLDWCIAGHAERNSLINAARHGIATNGCIMYMNCGIPCIPCLIEIINAGISEIVVTKLDIYDKEPSVTEYLLKESDLKVRLYEI